jgi:hypothetical protein
LAYEFTAWLNHFSDVGSKNTAVIFFHGVEADGYADYGARDQQGCADEDKDIQLCPFGNDLQNGEQDQGKSDEQGSHTDELSEGLFVLLCHAASVVFVDGGNISRHIDDAEYGNQQP